MGNEKIAEGGTNIQKKATVSWNIANALFGYFKPYEYGLVILPMTVASGSTTACYPPIPPCRSSTRR